MLAVIGHLLPVAVAVALSTAPITATVLLLLSPRGRPASVAFLVGWAAGMAALVAIFSAGLLALPGRASLGGPWAAIGAVLVGSALLAAAAISAIRALRRPRPSAESLPRWLRAVGALRPPAALGLGAALNLRPKGLLLAVAAGLTLGAAGLAPGDYLVCLALFTLFGASTVAAPVVIAHLAPRPAERGLVALRDGIIRYGRAITVVVLAGSGLAILGTGLTRL